MIAAPNSSRDVPLATSLRGRAKQRFRAWVNRRIPPARSVTLDQRRIFIFPTRVGLFFSLCLLVMLLASINFQNNLSYALTFLLATLFVVATLHTYANLSGLTIRGVRAQPAFSGQQTEFEIQIERGRKRDHLALYFSWPGSSQSCINLLAEDEERLQLHVQLGERGWYSPGRLHLCSTYPLGLLRCWTWIDLDLCALAYPRPLTSGQLLGQSSENSDGVAVPVEGSDDFYGFRDYRRGDSLRQIHWKGLAKGQSLQSKEYAAYTDLSQWLDWEMFPGVGVEQRLSHLCFWALEFDRRGDEYGLRLPSLVVEPSSGERHRDEVLKALALYGVEGQGR